MQRLPEIWNLLHDGSISAVSGSVPGAVRLDISIQYLRERFADPGETIRLTLLECSRFSYRAFGTQDYVSDPAAIAALDLEILSADMNGVVCEVCCVHGFLEVTACDASLELDSGRALPIDELSAVATAYWAEFIAKNKKT